MFFVFVSLKNTLQKQTKNLNKVHTAIAENISIKTLSDKPTTPHIPGTVSLASMIQEFKT